MSTVARCGCNGPRAHRSALPNRGGAGGACAMAAPKRVCRNAIGAPAGLTVRPPARSSIRSSQLAHASPFETDSDMIGNDRACGCEVQANTHDKAQQGRALAGVSLSPTSSEARPAWVVVPVLRVRCPDRPGTVMSVRGVHPIIGANEPPQPRTRCRFG